MFKNFLKSKKALTDEFIQELNKTEVDTETLSYLFKLTQLEINYQDKKGNGFLHKCIINHKVDATLWLLENGADVELANSNDITPLSLIIENQFVTVLEYILKNKLIDIDQKDKFGRTLLQNAVVLGYLDIAKLFIEHGIDITSKDNNERNVLYDALSFGNKEFIKYLLSFDNLDVNVIDKDEDSILHHPQARKEDENAIELIKAGADATIKNKEGETYLCNVALRGIEAEHIIETAIDAGNDINSRVKNNNSILMELVAASSKLTNDEKERRNSLLKISKVLINKGIDVNAVDNDNETALFRAVRLKDLEQVSFLLSSGIDPNIINNEHQTTLSIAVFQGIESLDIILLLLNSGANPFIKNHNHQSILEVLNKLILHTHNKKPLEDQVILDQINPDGQYLVILKEILNHIEDTITDLDTTGDPLFFEPLLEDHFPMFKLYLTNGINVQQQNVNGYNLFYKYVYKIFEEDNTEVDFQNNLSVLISKKLNQNAQDNTGYTVLHKIMHTKCNVHLFDTLTNVVQFDYHLGDQFGRSVMHAAVWNNHQLIMKRIHNLDAKTINKPDIYGILPITYAALLGNQELVLLFLDLQSNIKSNVKIAPQAIEKFSPMLKNLNKLTHGVEPLKLSHVEMLIEQIELDFNAAKNQRVYVS